MKHLQLLNLLEFASSFAAKNDVRIYLNDVLIKNDYEHTTIVAADGHKLVKIVTPSLIKNADDYLVLPEILKSEYQLLNNDSIKSAVKIKNLTVIEPSICNQTFPDYERLIPANRGFESMPSLNAAYLGTLCTNIAKLAKALKNKYPRINFDSLSETGSNIFTAQFDDISITSVIMPMRK